MTAARKLAAVPAAPAPKPRLKRVTLARALELHPNLLHARAWVKAVVYLRTRSGCGWKLDQPVARKQ